MATVKTYYVKFDANGDVVPAQTVTIDIPPPNPAGLVGPFYATTQALAEKAARNSRGQP
jgi:hypothetical protein